MSRRFIAKPLKSFEIQQGLFLRFIDADTNTKFEVTRGKNLATLSSVNEFGASLHPSSDGDFSKEYGTLQTMHSLVTWQCTAKITESLLDLINQWYAETEFQRNNGVKF